MALKIYMVKVYNTLTRKNDFFMPINGKNVNLFCCGITPYSYAHIGHAKTYVQFDIIVKYLRYRGYKVFYLQNITDIDDKIIKKAREEKKTWKEIARKYEREYLRDMKELGVNSVNNYARATDYIKEIQSQVRRLVEKGYGYMISDGYYFDLSKFPEYGKLARRTYEEAEDAVSRIDENKEKRNKGDFCLWKFSKKGEPSWRFGLKAGRPGWHIEDTAITEKEFGVQYDVHGGAVDLIFPHHEAEIAQMESISGKKPLVRYWLHTAFLTINKEKMSKSSKNFITIKDALSKYDGKVIRFFFASSHYRAQIDFSYDSLEQAKNSLERLNDFVRNLKNSKKEDDLKLIKKTEDEFIRAMDDDFNTARAIAAIFDFLRECNRRNIGGKKSYEFILDVDKIFNVLTVKEERLDKEIIKLVKEREKARKLKDWKRADSIRERLEKAGVILEDTEEGVKWRGR